MALKPQDIVVLLKLCGRVSDVRPPYSVIASDLGMSQSEIFAAVKRLKLARLLQGKEMGERPNLSAIKEFLVHGVKYSFPAERGGLTRGMATSYAAEPLRHLIRAGNDPKPVWPDPKGTERGLALKPLYKSVPAAARRDHVLYQRLALIDAIRDGRARERKLAEVELVKSLTERNG